jgi:alpha-tubulin suppressor-like RCC1 family protein
MVACSSSGGSTSETEAGDDGAAGGDGPSGSDDASPAPDGTTGGPEASTDGRADAVADVTNVEGGADAGGDTAVPDARPEAEAGPPPCTVEAGPTLNDAVEISAGGYGQACAIRSDGSVVCWGQNGDGQIGESPDAAPFSPTPVTIRFPADAGTVLATHVSCGTSISCILDQNSHVWCWGNDGFGQVGNGVVVPGLFSGPPAPPSMVLTPGGSPLGAIAISGGGQHACAMTPQDGIVCWGANNAGAVTSLPDAGTQVPYATPYPLTLDGGQPGLSQGTGAYYDCASDTTRAVCWGENTNGGVAPLQEAGVVYNGAIASEIVSAGGTMPLKSLSVGFFHACAVDAANQVYCWGALAYQTNEGGAQSLPTLSPLTSVGTVVKVTVGYSFTCVLTVDGTVYCSGVNTEGQIGPGALSPVVSTPSQVVDVDGGVALPGIVDISAGDNDVCALRRSPCGAGGPGEVVCWGLISSGVLAGYTDSGARGIPIPTPVYAPAP